MYFVDASRALRVQPFPHTQKRWTCAFRRILSDGGAVVRFEIGFHIPPSSVDPPTPLLETIGKILDLPCTVRGEKTAIKLLLVGKRLATLYAKSTAPRGTELRGDEVVAGQPTVLVQLDDLDRPGMPRFVDFDSDHLAFLKTTRNGIPMNVWMTNSGFGDPRNTRAALLRLSAEHQSLKYVLRDITSGNVVLEGETPQTAALQTYLNNASRTLSKESRFGIDQTALIGLTQKYETLCGGAELQMLRNNLDQIRPQIRTKVMVLVNAANSNQAPLNSNGPEFQWQGGFDQVELQAFLRSPRPLINVAWMADVTARLCPAVCRIDFPAIGRKATGFLVAKDLILTNWHVIEEFPGDPRDANLAGMELCFTQSSQPTRVFKLVRNSPGQALIKGSAVAQQDYVLLRVSEDVAAVLGVTPFGCKANSQPVVRQPIHMIQHPGGGALQISVDEDGVTGIYPDSGKVQYISTAHAGSSGSPCIDGNKDLVAIHHAEVQRAFGAIREGILLSSIFPDISPYL
ncbi:Trypsin-like peptidase domain-containing protein [Terriglobus roseus]|uniref:Trypsin-like peptidase domain-containing protein n=2 Tax=Terriglobus roseus TaxID=392734 RepID=A0A1H4N0P9_9BACT|nr:Trypsin-like peptidase domain-containing protein [Terriglobus roseus]